MTDKTATPTNTTCSIMCIQQRWSTFMDGVRAKITSTIVKIAKHAARNPLTYVLSITLFSFGILGIGFATSFELHVDTEEQLTAVWSRLIPQRNWLRSTFPRDPYALRVFVHAEGGNILTREGIQHALQVVDTVQSVPGYKELCEIAAEQSQTSNSTGGIGSRCIVQAVTSFWSDTEQLPQSETDVILTVNAPEFPDGRPVDKRDVMALMTDYYNTTVQAEAFPMAIMIPSTFEGAEEIAHGVLDALLNLRRQWKQDTAYHVEAMLTDYSIEQEMVNAAFKDVPLIPLVFVIMTLFTCLVFSSARRNGSNTSQPSQQRILLGLGAVVTILLSLCTSYGLLWILQVPFTNITQILPFVIFGIGLDDSFIIFQEYSRLDPKRNIVDRIEAVFQEVGLSIFCTSLTTTVACSLAMCSSFPMLRWCAMYAFPTVMIDAVYQITYFVALIVLDERRMDAKDKRQKEQQQQTEAPTKGDGAAIMPTPQHFFAGEEIQSSQGTGDQLTDLEEVPLELSPVTVTTAIAIDDEEESATPNLLDRSEPSSTIPPASLMDRFMHWYGGILMRPTVKIGVLVGFLAVTGGLFYSASQFRQGFNFEALLANDSYMQGFFHAFDTYGEGRGWLIPTAYFRNVNQSDPEIQRQMHDYVTELVTKMDTISDHPDPFFWVTHFQQFLTYDERLLDLDFNSQLDLFLSIDHFRLLYGDDIVRDPETGDIIASRCMMHMDKMDKNNVQKQIGNYKFQEQITMAQPINKRTDTEASTVRDDGISRSFFLYEGTFYVWEFYGIFKQELTLTVALCVGTVTFIGFLFLPHWTATLYLLPIISILCVDLIGFLQLCGVVLNGMSFYTITMSVGLLVDFNMHVLLKYYESSFTSREEKTKDALQSMGSSVALGGLSTFLGVIPLLFSTSDMMKILFYAFWGMVILGCSHGLIVLPVILSICGPEPSDPETELLEALPKHTKGDIEASASGSATTVDTNCSVSNNDASVLGDATAAMTVTLEGGMVSDMDDCVTEEVEV